MKNSRHYRRRLVRDSNQVPLEYEAGVLPTLPRRSLQDDKFGHIRYIRSHVRPFKLYRQPES